VKILGLSCSPRRMGNTEILVSEALSGAQNEGAEVELFSLSGKEIKPCDGCETCYKTGKCHINDDMQTIYQKLVQADGIIFGTPIYFYTMTSQAKALMDRTIALREPNFDLTNKVGGVVAVAGNLGIIDAIKDFYFYIALNHMVAADYVFGYASKKGAIRRDELAMKAAWELGREMVQLVAKGFEFPAEFKGRLTTYVISKYKL
jgi:multimeric flavodoxin WrbA